MTQQSRYIYALGVLFLLVAAGQAVHKLANAGPLLEVVIDFFLILIPGVLLLYIGSWFSRTEIDPALYPRIALWCLGGVGVMLFFIIVRAIHPGVNVQWSFETRAIALSLGSIAGLAIGIHEAHALTRERELDQQNLELKRTKSALTQRNTKLAETQDELEKTVREVKASNDRLEEFAYTASHDLQEPLRMITNYLELLDNQYADDLDEDASEFIAFALDGASRMQTLVEDLLQYSQVETQATSFESVDLETVVADVRADLQMRIEESNAEITTDELPRVDGDASQLRQLFQNLLSNAIEYSGDEPPRIHVSTGKQGGETVVTVADKGIGIESDDQERIFDIFQRLHTVGEHPGSGIGLALCQRIVEHHGGDIWVDSETNTGSTFSFTIPTAEKSANSPTSRLPE